MIEGYGRLGLVLVLLLAGCGPQKGRVVAHDNIFFSQPSVKVLHSPMQPTSLQAVVYTATAHAPNGISAIHIWMRTLGTQQFCCASGKIVTLTGRPVDRIVGTCSPPSRPIDDSCTFRGGPYRGQYVTYGATVEDSAGLTGEDRWIMFAAGEPQSQGNGGLDDPVPIYTRGDPATSVDVVFVPDNDYQGDFRQFISDVEPLVKDGYFADSLFGNSRKRWNFYVTYNTASATGIVTQPAPPAAPVPSCVINNPSNWLTLAATIDVAAIVHTRVTGSDGKPFRDCAPPASAGPNRFMVRSVPPHVSTVVHETGHAPFGLSDEYCCDGAPIETTWPHQNTFATKDLCKSSATAHGLSVNCVELTASLAIDRACGGRDSSGNLILGLTNNQWVLDAAGDLMGCYKHDVAAAVPGTLDAARFQWFFNHL